MMGFDAVNMMTFPVLPRGKRGVFDQTWCFKRIRQFTIIDSAQKRNSHFNSLIFISVAFVSFPIFSGLSFYVATVCAIHE